MDRLNTAGKEMARAMTEDQLKTNVLDLAAVFGYHRIHFRPARTNQGWRTAYEGEDGYPDITLMGGTRIIVAELKTQRGKLRDGQLEWLKAADRSGAIARLWRPADWIAGEIEDILHEHRPEKARR